MLWVPKMTLNHPEVNPYIATTDAVLHQVSLSIEIYLYILYILLSPQTYKIVLVP